MYLAKIKKGHGYVAYPSFFDIGVIKGKSGSFMLVTSMNLFITNVMLIFM